MRSNKNKVLLILSTEKKEKEKNQH